MAENRSLLLKLFFTLAITLLIGAGGYVGYQKFLATEIAKPIPKNEQTIFNDLDETVQWYRHINILPLSGISTRESFLQETLYKDALKSLRYSFDVARTQASLFENSAAEASENDPTPPKDDDGTNRTLTPEQMLDVIQNKAQMLEQRRQTAQQDLRRAHKNDRPVISAGISKLDSEIALTKMQQDLIGSIFNKKNTDQQTLSLEAQIDNLAATLPELEAKKTPTSPASNASAATTVPAQASAALTALTGIAVTPPADTVPAEKDSKGFLRLIRDLLTLLSQRQEIQEVLNETEILQSKNKDKLSELQSSVIAIVKRSNEMSQEITQDIEQLDLQNQEMTEMTQSFKAMSDLIIPLNKKKRTLAQAEQTLTQWHTLFDESIAAGIRRVASRFATILLALLIPFAISEVMRRALSQYVTDARQRRQMNIIRRIFLGLAIAFIIVLNLVSELASLATFIGFVTAGLAVALQNIILSIVAHFFFFGRYGIRVGSRVSIGSTTGDVIEMGIVRLYLMEMTEDKGQYRPTGRIVSYPNSILFQSTAFFKQVPGANYRWHEITLPLAPETERALARTKLNEALDSIFKDSKTMLTMQRIAMSKSTGVKVKEPRPEGHIEKTVDSLNLTIRYPVDIEQSEHTDKNVMRQITEIFERLPSVKLLDNEPPTIKKSR